MKRLFLKSKYTIGLFFRSDQWFFLLLLSPQVLIMSCNRCQNIVLIHLLLFTVVFSYAQDGIGIGTKTPRKTLEIAGDMKISQNIDIGVIENLEDDDTSTFLIQDTDQSIKILDVSNPTGAALGYIQEYVITNPQGDWVLDFDTGVPSDDYVLISLSAYFDKELVMSGNAQDNASIPYTSAFIRIIPGILLQIFQLLPIGTILR